MEQLIKYLKCISDETRLKMLKLLLEQRLCVCELTEILQKSQPCISQHLRRFKELNLVNEYREEQWSYYEINQAVYQDYLNRLVGLQGQSYSNLGMEELYNNLKLVKK